MQTYFNVCHPFVARIFICNLIFHQIKTISHRRIITPINVLLLLFIFFHAIKVIWVYSSKHLWAWLYKLIQTKISSQLLFLSTSSGIHIAEIGTLCISNFAISQLLVMVHRTRDYNSNCMNGIIFQWKMEYENILIILKIESYIPHRI